MKDDNQQPPDSAEERDTLRTAYALGELDETEAARFEAEMNSEPATLSVMDELRQLRTVLEESHESLPMPQASSELRAQILERLTETIQLKQPVRATKAWNRRHRISLTFACVTAVCLMLVLLPALPSMWRNQTEKQVAVMQDGSVRFIWSLSDSNEAKVVQVTSEAGGSNPHSDDGIMLGAEGYRDPQVPSSANDASTTPANKESQDYLRRSDSYSATGPKIETEPVPAEGLLKMSKFATASGVAADAKGETRGKSGVAVGKVWISLGEQPGTRRSTTFSVYDTPGMTQSRPLGDRAQASSRGRVVTREGRRETVAGYLFRNEKAARATTGTEQYESLPENSFLAVSEQAVSTFSIDVDTASYANVRRFLTQGRLPPPAAVRIEEMINYFSYNDPGPQGREPFGVTMEVAECPWTTEHQLVRIALKGKSVRQEERPPCNLVFLLDVSGSMSPSNKLPLLQQAMKLLTDQLTENDRVAIVTYAGNAGLRLDSITGDQHGKIRRTIESLHSGGSTHGSAGIQLAYEKAEQYFLEEGINRVILATDGDLNVGVTQDDALVELIKSKAKSGVFLTVLGFGEGNLKDAKLEKLADNGNGSYAYIDNLREARRVLVEQVAGSLVTIAKDVKIKVEFNPAHVHAYRLIGYENRLMTPPEFDDDRKDAGEIGAGHSVTALYEIAPADALRTVARLAQGLKYQQPPQPVSPPLELTEAAHSGELLTLSLRYKQPDGEKSILREFALKETARPFSTASQDFRFSSAVATFGMLLRGSQFRGQATFDAVEKTAAEALGSDPGGYRTEFLDLVRRTAQLSR